MRRALRREDGFAIPVAIWMLVLGLLFGGLAMSQALLALRGSNSSWNSTRASAAAQAGLRMAVYNINTLGLNGASLTKLGSVLDVTQCAAQATVTAPLGTIGITVGKSWCDPITIDLGNGATVTYQTSSVINCNLELGYPALSGLLTLGTIQDCLKRKIVAVGQAGGVQRRAYEETRATATANVIGIPLLGNLINHVTLQPAKPVAGTFRECPATGATASNPAAGC